MKEFKIGTKSLGAALAATAMLGTLAVPGVAEASSKGRKNTAIGLGAAAAHQILTGKTTNGVLLGAGAAYAYKQYQDSRQDENRRDRAAQYRGNTSRTGNAYRSGNAYGGASTRTTRTTRTNGVTRTNSRYVPPQHNTAKVTTGAYVFTGPISSESAFDSRSITVNHNGVLRPASVPSTAVVMRDGARVSLFDLQPGETVRVTAVQTSPNVWRASRIDVVEPVVTTARVPRRTREERVIRREERVARRESMGDMDRIDRRERVGAADRFNRTDRGELTMADYSGVGVVQSVDEDEDSFKVRIGENTRTVFAMDARMTGVDRVRDLREGDRVRIQGDIYGRDVFATRVTMLD